MSNAGKDDWQDCSSEVIADLVSTKRKISRRLWFVRTAGIATVLFTGVAAVSVWYADEPVDSDSRIQQNGMNAVVPTNCDHARVNLPQYHCGHLTDRERRIIAGHLVGCERCAKYYSRHYVDAKLGR